MKLDILLGWVGKRTQRGGLHASGFIWAVEREFIFCVMDCLPSMLLVLPNLVLSLTKEHKLKFWTAD